MPYNILIVDDNTLFTAVLALGIVKEFKFNFFESHSATDAIEKFKSEKFDLLLLDLRLPDSCGIELLRKIRKFSDVPVIIISGSSDVETQIKCFEAGADHFIPKDNFSIILTLLKIKNTIERYKH
jgi:DNA-binding response OmpR family regulator